MIAHDSTHQVSPVSLAGDVGVHIGRPDALRDGFAGLVFDIGHVDVRPKIGEVRCFNFSLALSRTGDDDDSVRQVNSGHGTHEPVRARAFSFAASLARK